VDRNNEISGCYISLSPGKSVQLNNINICQLSQVLQIEQTFLMIQH
jgi:hypothetical protein